MMVMTAKVNLKKILMILGGIAGVILLMILLLGGGEAEATSAPMSANDSRVEFLKGFGWDVAASPVESGQVKIPTEMTEVFDRYNQLQKEQGYDLSRYAGKSVMRYVYKVNNYPGATQPVYATVLVYKNQVIGGDVTDTAANGKIRGFTMPQGTTAPTETTAPATQDTTAAG
jgi:hypothetical protein